MPQLKVGNIQVIFFKNYQFSSLKLSFSWAMLPENCLLPKTDKSMDRYIQASFCAKRIVKIF